MPFHVIAARPNAQGRPIGVASARQARSPITAAKPNRSELSELNKRQPRAMPSNQRPSGGGSSDRGYGSAPNTRGVRKPTPSMGTQGGGRNTAMSGANQGRADRAASQRGKQSLLARDDVAALTKVLGPGTEALVNSGDAVADKTERTNFLAAHKQRNSLVAEGSGMTLVIGDNDWPMPVPLVQREGRWAWDGTAGADEMVFRRIGANELGAIDVCRGYVQAQFDYAGEGYRRSAERQPYHGYYYRMLYAQGPNAKGGARDYFKDGLMTEGFALVAWPAEYGSSGVQTFIVNHEGVVFQKDLGEDTTNVVETIKLFDPDASWTTIVRPHLASARVKLRHRTQGAAILTMRPDKNG